MKLTIQVAAGVLIAMLAHSAIEYLIVSRQLADLPTPTQPARAANPSPVGAAPSSGRQRHHEPWISECVNQPTWDDTEACIEKHMKSQAPSRP